MDLKNTSTGRDEVEEIKDVLRTKRSGQGLASRKAKTTARMGSEEMKSTIKNIYTVLCILIIGIVAALGIAVMSGYSPKVVLSESMEPEVIRDSLVFVDTNTALGEVAVGDNVVFKLDGVQILHKVRALGYSSNPSFQSTTGENEVVIVSGLKGSDETVVDSSMYIGRQGVVFPRIGRYVLWLEKDGMWIAVTLAVLLILIGCVPWKRKRNKVKS